MKPNEAEQNALPRFATREIYLATRSAYRNEGIGQCHAESTCHAHGFSGSSNSASDCRLAVCDDAGDDRGRVQHAAGGGRCMQAVGDSAEPDAAIRGVLQGAGGRRPEVLLLVQEFAAAAETGNRPGTRRQAACQVQPQHARQLLSNYDYRVAGPIISILDRSNPSKFFTGH
ncbi:hypothetical protein ZIOFF_025800 [Zingiber officinale]|uniref:Uncharacterized protein n=1 Tax=Zingiber officinale TaxID=94328 RepID=A0A8J5LK08_ZINOF|nr:hypothetical protein ZIOFF_025800 [Zingiber officinale]